MSDDTKLYTLHTSAPYDVASAVAVQIAMRTGHVAALSETPDGAVVIVPRRVWGRGRWLAVTLTLAAAPLVLRYVHVTGLQGFGLGWMAAAVVLLARRG